MTGFRDATKVANSLGERGIDPSSLRLRAFFIQRLHRFDGLKEAPQLTPSERRLVSHALYSTYWDCVGVGVRAEASLILRLPFQVTSTQ